MKAFVALTAVTLLACEAPSDLGSIADSLRQGYSPFVPVADVATDAVLGQPTRGELFSNVDEALVASASDGDRSYISVASGASAGSNTMGFTSQTVTKVVAVIIKAVARSPSAGTVQLGLSAKGQVIDAGAPQALTRGYLKYVSELSLAQPLDLADLEVTVSLTGPSTRYSSLWIEVLPASPTPGSPCVPTTCAKLGSNCGPASDGCGGTLDCGACVGSDTCGGAGLANRCGTPVPPATGWSWEMSGIIGGGLGQVIAADPFRPGFATLGGDSWGVYNTSTRGDMWFAATKGLTVDDIGAGLFNFEALAYSRKFPGTVYGLTGRVAVPAGGFVAVSGNSTRVLTTSVSGGYSGLSRSDHPRPSGHRILVDLDPASGLEYLYIGAGDGGGVQRSTDGGRTFQKIALGGPTEVITGMAFDPVDTTTLYVATHNGTFRVTNLRGTAASTALPGAPTRVEELAVVGGALFAAANTSGVFRVTDRGSTWTALGSGFFPATSEWAAVGGAGQVVYVGCSNPDLGKSLAKSVNGGDTWSWVSMPSNVSTIPWGRTEPWWLAQAFDRIVMGNNTFEVTDIAVDAFDSNIVYLSSRSGAWKSENGGLLWRPAVNGVGGTMHSHIKVTGNTVETDDTDWTSETSTDGFHTASRAATFSGDSTLTLDHTKNGHRYQVTSTFPRDFLVDGVSIADEFFRATCIRATDVDVSDDGTTVYVAQFGGGVIVARKK